jgi:hypothetical protein
LSKNDSLVKVAAPVAISVLNVIKEANASGATNLVGRICTMVGAKWGVPVAQAVDTWIKLNIDKVITGVGIANQAASTQDNNQKLLLVSRYIASLDIDVKSVKISQIAAMLAKDLDDSHLSLVEIVSIITALYKTA